jgi:hypothetical protein
MANPKLFATCDQTRKFPISLRSLGSRANSKTGAIRSPGDGSQEGGVASSQSLERGGSFEMVYNRREFISLASAALSLPAISPVFAEVLGEIQCLVYDAERRPSPPAALERFHLCDSLMRPISAPFETGSGEVRFKPPTEKSFRIALPLNVPGFGQVFVYADDEGAGYTDRSLGRANHVVLNCAFARDRMATVRNVEADCKQSGVVISTETQGRIDAAQSGLRRAEASGADRTAQVRASMESLRDSLWAGEMLVLARARTAIERRIPRNGFLFGCNGFGLAPGYPDTLKQFAALLTTRQSPFTKVGSNAKKGTPIIQYSKPRSTHLVAQRSFPKGTREYGLSQKTHQNCYKISPTTRRRNIVLDT